MYEGLKITYK